MKYLIITILLLYFLPSHAQKTLLARVEADGKFGCINQAGDPIIPLIYNDMDDEWNEGLIAVNSGGRPLEFTEGGKWGFCNAAGKLVIDTIYDQVRPFHEGLAAVYMDSLWGFIDHQGKMVIPPVFLRASDFSEGLCAVETRDEKSGFITKDGKWAIEPVYESAGDFKNGISIVVLEIQSWKGMVRKNRWGAIDKKGNTIIKPEFEFMRDFHEGFAVVKLPGSANYYKYKSGFINSHSKLVCLKNYDKISDFYEGRAVLFFNNKTFRDKGPNLHSKCGFIDTSGNIITKEPYNFVELFHNGYAIVGTGERLDDDLMGSIQKDEPLFGLIDKSGNKVLDFEYRQLQNTNKPGWIIAEKKGTLGMGVINVKGETILPFKYKKLTYLNNDLFSASTDSATIFMDLTGKIIYKSRELEPAWANNYFGIIMVKLRNQEKYGFLDTRDYKLIGPVYDSVSDFVEVLQ